MTKPLPKVGELVNYEQAAAGHDGVLSDVTGELFIKPCTSQEINFYTDTIRDHPEFAYFMPTYLGNLTLAQKQEASFEEQSAALISKHTIPEVVIRGPIDSSSDSDTPVILGPEDVSFKEPPAAPIAKDVVMRDYSSDSDGPIILQADGVFSKEPPTAFIEDCTIPEVDVPSPVHSANPSDIHATPLGPARTKKIVTDQAIVLENTAYGFVKPNVLDVKLGVRLWADDAAQEKKERFDKVTQDTTHKDLGFRIAGMRVWQGNEAMDKPSIRINHTTTTTSEGYKIYDKNFGRDMVKTTNVLQCFSEFVFVESADVDEELGKLILEAFITELEGIQDVMEREESRMYSGSLLFVFEGDGKALRKAMEDVTAQASDIPSPPTMTTGSSEEDEGYDTKGSSGEDEGYEESEDAPRGPKIYAVKLIDFAHAKWTPGQGADENSLKGIRSVVKIMKDLQQGGKDFC